MTTECNNCCVNAIQACQACIAGCAKDGCTRCLDHCMTAAEISELCMKLTARNSQFTDKVRALCVEITTACANHCGNCDKECCKKCAEACRLCAEGCSN